MELEVFHYRFAQDEEVGLEHEEQQEVAQHSHYGREHFHSPRKYEGRRRDEHLVLP